MNKLLAVAALAGTGALLAATATHSPRLATAPASNVSLLQRYDLSALLRTLPDDPTAPTDPMNGFFGADRYRIELMTTKVRRDPQQPTRYQLWGKDRFKGRITPFAGTVTLTEAHLTTPADKETNSPAVYTATGTYELREEAQTGAGLFKGRLALDFKLEDGKPALEYYFHNYQKSPTKGGAILYDGTWTSATGQVKPAVWVANIFGYNGPQVFRDFIIGERDQHFNPKYARLGWNNYWRNDEWWTSSPQASVKAKL